MTITRREMIRNSLATLTAVSAGSATWPLMQSAHAASKGTINFADVGVSDPDGN